MCRTYRQRETHLPTQCLGRTRLTSLGSYRLSRTLFLTHVFNRIPIAPMHALMMALTAPKRTRNRVAGFMGCRSRFWVSTEHLLKVASTSPHALGAHTLGAVRREDKLEVSENSPMVRPLLRFPPHVRASSRPSSCARTGRCAPAASPVTPPPMACSCGCG